MEVRVVRKANNVEFFYSIFVLKKDIMTDIDWRICGARAATRRR